MKIAEVNCHYPQWSRWRDIKNRDLMIGSRHFDPVTDECMTMVVVDLDKQEALPWIPMESWLKMAEERKIARFYKVEEMKSLDLNVGYLLFDENKVKLGSNLMTQWGDVMSDVTKWTGFWKRLLMIANEEELRKALKKMETTPAPVQ